MPYRMILLQILGCGIMLTPLRAADSITGVWKLDVSSSTFTMPPPKEQIETYRELASGDMELVLSRTQKDGAPTTTTFTWPTRGGLVHDPAAALPKGATITEVLLSPGDWFAIFMVDGKQQATIHKVISPDGKTMIQTIEAMDPQGRPSEQVQIFHRQ